MKKRKGDTLIEVMFAIGIFSMVAISVVAVMSGGISSSQTALETTLARGEIDSQAEALRFIQASFIAEKDADVKDGVYEALWQEIGNKVVEVNKITTEEAKNKWLAATSSSGATQCQDLYRNSYVQNNAFVINYKQISSTASNSNNIFISAKDNDNFKAAATYPRLVFDSEPSSLVGQSGPVFSAAEGIYVIAATDSDTKIIESDDTGIMGKNESAYYDFYIRTCWYGTGDEIPTSIATTIRLYNPLATAGISHDNDVSPFTIYFDGNGGTIPGDPQPERQLSQKISRLGSKLMSNQYSKNQYHFAKWTTEKDGGGYSYSNNASLGSTDITRLQPEVIDGVSTSKTLYAQWASNVLHIEYVANGTDWKVPSQDCTIDINGNPNDGCFIKSKTEEGRIITRTNYKLVGWCDGAVIPGKFVNGVIQDDKCQEGSTIYEIDKNGNGAKSLEDRIPAKGDGEITLTAMWAEDRDTIYVKLVFHRGNLTRRDNDCDAHVVGLKSNLVPFWAYYGNPISNDVDQSNLAFLTGDSRWTISPSMTWYRDVNGNAYQYDQGSGEEEFTINTIGGKDYYFFVQNYDQCNLCARGEDNNYVEVSSARGRFETQRYYPTASTCSSDFPDDYYWNVFAYQDGTLVDGANTITSDPIISDYICNKAQEKRVDIPGCNSSKPYNPFYPWF